MKPITFIEQAERDAKIVDAIHYARYALYPVRRCDGGGIRRSRERIRQAAGLRRTEGGQSTTVPFG